jgi:hypothetical protein
MVEVRPPFLATALDFRRKKSKSWTLRGVPARHAPVFLHGGWRCGGTYIWNRFRQSQHAICFFEPFHETLARRTPRRLRQDAAHAANSRQPPPCREEYLPLIGVRGVRGYQEDFAVARYFPSPAGVAPELRYLSRLLEYASLEGKRPVFGCSRSLARAAAIKQAFGGYHVLIRRNPIQQWLSARAYRAEEGSTYFELCQFLILALAPPDSPAGRFARRLGLPRPPAGRFREQFDFLRGELRPWSDELSYRAFLGVTALSHASARPAADLTIDLDLLNEVPDYRRAIRAAVFERTGLTVAFNDCRLRTHDTLRVTIDFAAVESDVLRTLRAFGVTCNMDLLTPKDAKAARQR